MLKNRGKFHQELYLGVSKRFFFETRFTGLCSESFFVDDVTYKSDFPPQYATLPSADFFDFFFILFPETYVRMFYGVD